jgi:5-hydroxyisourate hydrolase-like protein (transthyretin family)
VIEERSGMDVPGAKVVITAEDGTTRTYVTNEDGVIVDKNGKIPVVPAGKYTITVSEVPTGYEVKTGEVGTVVVPKNSEGHHDAVIATEKGAIIITVLDEDTGMPVEGAEIVVITPEGEKKVFITDENGQVTEYAERDQFGNYVAKIGEYEYTVVKVPVGYHVTVGEKQTGVVVVDELTELEAKIAPSTGGLDIKVIDEETKEPVPNATVEVIYPDGSTHTFITDENGMVTELTKTDEKGRYLAKTGEYKITVIRVPDGYVVTTGQTKTEIIETDQVKHHIAEIVTTDSSTRRKPSDKTAQTGDDTPITMLFILMMISACGFAGVVLKKKKAKR